MNGTSEFIVSLWVLPVTVFIIIPLAMLAVWTVVKVVNRLARLGHKAPKPSFYPVSKPGCSTD